MQQLNSRSIIAVSVSMALLSACGSVSKVREEIAEHQPAVKKNMESPFQTTEVPRVEEQSGKLLVIKEVTPVNASGSWLRSIQVYLDVPSAITLSQVVSKLASQGLNISSDLPLDNFVFSGVVNKTNAENALKQILGSVGLDYSVNDAQKLITIKPLSTRTWYLNIGNRKTSYTTSGVASLSSPSGGGSTSTGSTSSAGQSNQNSSSGGGSNGGGSTTGQSSGGSGGSSQGGSSSAASSGGTTVGGTGTAILDDFWSSMDVELSKRLTVLIPNPKIARNSLASNAAQVSIGTPLPGFGGPTTFTPGSMGIPAVPVQNFPMQNGAPMPQQLGAGNGNEEDGLYVSRRIGRYSLNPETGAISIQAPKWLLAELDTYLKRVQQSYNSDISFEGRLFLVTSNDMHSEGFDLSAFAQFASSRYGALISNNSLGGITVGFPANNNIPLIQAGNQTVGGGLLGVASAKDGLAIFNAYLAQLGNVFVLQKPRVSTTSGVPGNFSNIQPKVYTILNQTSSNGSTGAAVQATTNTIAQKDFGTELRVNPRFDVASSCTRTLITLKNLIYAGDQTIIQVLSAGNTIQTIPTKIPTQRILNYEGEALLCDGDLIVLGGQSEETLQSDENGLPIGSTPLSGPFGTKTSTRSTATYYFALRASVRAKQ